MASYRVGGMGWGMGFSSGAELPASTGAGSAAGGLSSCAVASWQQSSASSKVSSLMASNQLGILGWHQVPGHPWQQALEWVLALAQAWMQQVPREQAPQEAQVLRSLELLQSPPLQRLAHCGTTSALGGL
jgi:hypothetical protein